MKTAEIIKSLTSAPVAEYLGLSPEISSFANCKSRVEVSLDEERTAPTSAKVNANILNVCPSANNRKCRAVV